MARFIGKTVSRLEDPGGFFVWLDALDARRGSGRRERRKERCWTLSPKTGKSEKAGKTGKAGKIAKAEKTAGKLWSCSALLAVLLVWQLVTGMGIIDPFLLPSPIQVGKAFILETPTLLEHSAITLSEAFVGLALGIFLGWAMAVVMDWSDVLYRAFYPLIVLTQTIPTVAIAPLLVLWFGYEMTPKVVLIVLTTFFPIAVGLLNGFKSADPDAVNLLRAMGASRRQIFRYIKLPGAMSQFFSGLKISVSYAVVGAVISEWLGGFGGLGVYMTRVRKAFSFDKMFAVIFLVSAISLLLMSGVEMLQRLCMPWSRLEEKDEQKGRQK